MQRQCHPAAWVPRANCPTLEQHKREPPLRLARSDRDGGCEKRRAGGLKHLVEDDNLVRTVTVDALEEEGFEVIEAATAEEALDRCRERIADALLTDIM